METEQIFWGNVCFIQQVCACVCVAAFEIEQLIGQKLSAIPISSATPYHLFYLNIKTVSAG